MDKLKIVVCDDVLEELEETIQLLKEYEQLHNELRIELISFCDSKLAEKYLHKNLDTDLVILDICMPTLSGIELAQSMRAVGSQCHIVFLSESQEYAFEAFAVNATQYILKPIKRVRFFGVLDLIVSSQNHTRGTYLILKSEQRYYKVNKRSIVFVKCDKNYQFCNLKDGSILKVRMTSQQLYELLDDETLFSKCGASYIINWEYVIMVSKNNIEFVGDRSVSIPRRIYPLMKEIYLKYYCEKKKILNEV